MLKDALEMRQGVRGRETWANFPAADEPEPNHLVLPAFSRVGKSQDLVAEDVDCHHGEQEIHLWLLHACSRLRPSRNPCHLSCTSRTLLNRLCMSYSLCLLILHAQRCRSVRFIQVFFLQTISHIQYFIVSIMLPPVIPSPSLLLSAPSPHHKTHFHVHHPSPSCFLAK